MLLFSASLRTDSLNTRLARLARSVLETARATVDWATMNEFDGPSYNQDLETGSGFPPGPRRDRPGGNRQTRSTRGTAGR